MFLNEKMELSTQIRLLNNSNNKDLYNIFIKAIARTYEL